MTRLTRNVARWTAALALPVFWFQPAAFAADFVVTRYDDPPPDGCQANDCSLREAVIAAGGGANRVVLSAGTYQLSIPDTGGSGSLSGGFRVSGEIEIVGLGAELTRIDGAGVSETILVGEFASLDLTLRGIRFQNSDENGVLLLDGSALIEDCAFVDNGGLILGVGLGANLAMESLVLRRSTITGNSSDGLSVSAASATLENVTSTANGLLELRFTGDGSGGSVQSCTHCTLAHEGGTGDEVRVSFGSASFANSIVAGSCVFGSGGAIDSLGGNVESSGASCQFDQASDQTNVAGVDLALGALAANGGLTTTIALAPGSVALGAGLEALCLGEDQRGASRGAECDAGAFEETGAAVPQPLFIDGFAQGNPGAWSQISP